MKTWGFTFGHIIMQFVISYIVGWLIIILTFSEDYSLFINYVIAPFVGFIFGIYIDHKFLLNLNSEYHKKKSGSGDSKPKDGNNITINVGAQGADVKENKPASASIEKSKSLDESILGTDEFETVILNTINTLIANQNKQCEQITEQSEQLRENIDKLDSIRNAEMINKKVELKALIYKCLNSGFATPEENDRITQFYLVYTDLGGNHEIQTLYEQHYLKLNVHEDRRKLKEDSQFNIYVNNSDYNGPDRRQSEKTLCTYGEFDNEYVECKNVEV